MNSTPSSPRRILLRFSFFLFLVVAGVAGRPVFSQQQPAPNTPLGTVAKQRLSPKDRKEVFEKVWKEIRDHYYDSNFNAVDWNEVHQRYLPLVAAVKSDQEFYVLMSQMTSELHDAHTRFSSPEQWRNFQRQQGITVGFSVDDLDGKTVVTNVIRQSNAARAGIEPGMVVLTIDGTPVAERVAKIEKKRLPSSSERATRWFIYNRVFAGPLDTPLEIGLQRPNGSSFEVTITRQLHSAGRCRSFATRQVLSWTCAATAAATWR